MKKLLVLRALHKQLTEDFEKSAAIIEEERTKQIILVRDKELAEMSQEEFRTRMVNIYNLVDELQEDVKRLEAKDAYYEEKIREEEEKVEEVRELLYKKEKSVEYLEFTVGQREKKIAEL